MLYTRRSVERSPIAWIEAVGVVYVAEYVLEFPLESGGAVTVVTAGPHGPVEPHGQQPEVTRGRSGGRPDALPTVVERVGVTFESALRKVRPAAAAVLETMRSGLDPPDEVIVEFGLQLSAEAGAIVAMSAAQANFKVTLSWRRDAPIGAASESGSTE